MKNKKLGCEAHSDCLTCPFPDCIADVKGHTKRSVLRKIRMTRVDELKASGHTLKEIAKIMGYQVRTIQRYFARNEEGSNDR